MINTETPPKLTRNEGLKANNPILSGTISQTLADASKDRFSDDDYEFLKFHGIYQQDDRDKRKVAKEYIYMVRGRLPGGVVHPSVYLAFDQLCSKIGGISDTEALLGFLHHNGVLFYRPGLFQNQIILDQNWALEAIFSIFHREKCLKQLKKLHGRFGREDLELLIWSRYTIKSPRLVAPETRRQALVSSARVPVESPSAERYHD